jgi:GT2 family glycosyltransferase
MKRVAVLLVNWNGWGDTLECLESLFRLEGLSLLVILCDNASDDNSLARFRDWADGRLNHCLLNTGTLRTLTFPPVPKPIPWVEYDQTEAIRGGGEHDVPFVLIKCDRNLGFAGGNNVGLRYLLARRGFDYVWLLNNDTVVMPSALSALVTKMESDPVYGICGSTLLRYHAPHRVQARGGGYYCKWIGLPWHLGQLGKSTDLVDERRVERWINYVVGASMFVSMRFIEDIGLLNESYFLFFEEVDWVLRSQGRYRLAYAPASIVYHKVGSSIGTSSNPCKKSLICDWYAVRNRILFTRRFFPEALPTVYISVLTAMIVRLLVGRWKCAGMIWRILCGEMTPPFSERENG